MKRKEARLLKKLEKDPAEALMETQNHYYPQLQARLNRVKDPRDVRYTTYSSSTILGMGLVKNICGIPSMRQMTACLNSEGHIRNVSEWVWNRAGELPHYVTVNEYLKGLDPSELQKVRKDIIYRLIRMKSFDGAKFRKRWLVIVDGTWLQTYKEKPDEYCMCREYQTGDGTPKHVWYRMALEAKIVLGDGLVLSLDTEFIENNGEDADRQKALGAEKAKQDCEWKAFLRLSERLKRDFPRLPVVLLCDSLYAGEPVFDLCKENGWNYIIRYKEGSIPSIMEEYEAIPEKVHGASGDTEYVNGIGYRKHEVNVLKYEEIQVRKKVPVKVRFQWITDILLTKGNVYGVACAGRKRWKIENEGFNQQKNLRYSLGHGNSQDRTALKNHYLITQIADIFRQLYVYRHLKRLGIERSEKNISSDLLTSFGQPTTKREDIFTDDRAHDAPTN